MNKDIIFSITNDINNIYQELYINGLKISKEDRYNLINKLKELIKHETEIYSYLDYDEISKIRKYFNDNYTNIGEEISERIINKIDEIIMIKYTNEFYLEYSNDEYDEEDKKYDKYSFIYTNILKRDLFYLKLYFLNKFNKNDGYIGNGIYLNNSFINQRIDTKKFIYCSLYPYIENEVMKNNFEVNDFYLNSKLVCELSLFDELISKTCKVDAFKNDFIDRLNKILTVNDENIFDLDTAITFLESLVYILGVLILDKDYLTYINKAFEEISNEFVYYIFYDNLKEFNEDKKNIKVLSLINK